jgi:hypothetical protein
MIYSILENGGLVILAFTVVVGVLFLHFLLFQEYQKQDKFHQARIADLQRLVALELERSGHFSDQVDFLGKQKKQTQDQLDLIKLQLEALKKSEKKDQ